MGDALYISDNRNDKLVKVTPADFLNAKKAPEVVEVFAGEGVNPNGVYPSRTGMLLMGGFVAPDKPRALYALGVSGQIRPLSEPIGRIDGLYEMKDGSILFTDWNTGSLFHWSEKDRQEGPRPGLQRPGRLLRRARRRRVDDGGRAGSAAEPAALHPAEAKLEAMSGNWKLHGVRVVHAQRARHQHAADARA